MPDSLLSAHAYPGALFMIVAPSGAGKSTLVNALLEQDKQLHLSISYTTRAPRPNEVNGREYYFVSPEDFFARQRRGEFIESAEVHGHYYATSRRWMDGQMHKGQQVLFEIDWQGARQLRAQFCHAVGIFIAPPSFDALEERLKKRAQDVPQVIASRIEAARDEMPHASECDYVVINDSFKKALAELQCIVTAARLRFISQYARYANLFAGLGIGIDAQRNVSERV